MTLKPMKKKINKHMRSNKSQVERILNMNLHIYFIPIFFIFFFFFRNILATKFLFISRMRMYVTENNLYFYLLSFSNYSCSILLNTKA